MEVIIIYDAAYPSTRLIARAIGDGFGPDARVRLGNATLLSQKALPEVDVLLVGSHAGRSRPTKTVRNFLKNLPKSSLVNVSIGAFETKVKSRFLFFNRTISRNVKKNKTAKYIQSILLKKGGIAVLDPERFYFFSQKTPYTNELKRAVQWGKELKDLCDL